VAQKKKSKKKKTEITNEYGNFSNPKKKRQHGAFDENGRVVPQVITETEHLLTCLQCYFEGPIWKFAPSFSPYHDVRCPQCGSVKVNTSVLKSMLGKKYGFGNVNKIERRFLPKNDDPEYGD
jgi:Zn finger protein HypA/HybF involved in hydrogenase expression